MLQMNHRVPASVIGLGMLIAVLAMVAWAGQAPLSTMKATPITKNWTPPHIGEGQPDLQGIWGFATITPLERPADLKGKEFFTESEAFQYEKDFLKRNNRDRR